MKKLFGSFKAKCKKFSAIFCAALMSMCMFVTSFAEETASSGSSGTINYSAIGDAFKTGVTDAVTGTITAVSAMIPVCISIIGLGICIKTFKKFIGKLT